MCSYLQVIHHPIQLFLNISITKSFVLLYQVIKKQKYEFLNDHFSQFQGDCKKMYYFILNFISYLIQKNLIWCNWFVILKTKNIVRTFLLLFQFYCYNHVKVFHFIISISFFLTFYFPISLSIFLKVLFCNYNLWVFLWYPSYIILFHYPGLVNLYKSFLISLI